MPFNGAGVFSRTPGTRIANQGPLVSAQVNDETDNLVAGINGKVNLDGLLTYTGLHTLFGDGTALLHQASVRQVQNGVLSHATAVGGTADAIQLTMTPANTTLTTRERIRWTSAGANTVVAPTLSKDGGVTNKTIKKGVSAALAVGDTGAAGYECEAEYNGTDWILLNPVSAGGSALSAASATEVLTGTDTTKYVTSDANAALWEKGADIASAGTISVGEGGTFDVTGTTSITDIDPATDKAGRTFRLVHEGIHTLTHNASTMINLTGANIITAVGDVSTWQSEGSDVVRMIDYARATGAGLLGGGITTATPVASTSGTSVAFTGIPATASRIVIMLSGTSLSGSDSYALQIGDSGGLETSGYSGSASFITEAAAADTVTADTSQWLLTSGGSTVEMGVITLNRFDANTWLMTSTIFSKGVSDKMCFATGAKTLSGTLDRFSLKTNGSNTFDLGSVTYSVE